MTSGKMVARDVPHLPYSSRVDGTLPRVVQGHDGGRNPAFYVDVER